MTSQKRGLFFIINNENYTPESQFNRRIGSQRDVASLHRVFAKLNFEVRLYRDITAEKAIELLIEGM